MQLEAADSYIERGNSKRSQEIIQKLIEQARKTLREARIVIDDLRESSITDKEFEQLIEKEIQRFMETTPIEVDSEIRLIAPISNLVREHSFYIISECLTNIAKHSHATKAVVSVISEKNELFIRVEDNGVGFGNAPKGSSGKYGLLGLKERVRIVGGILV